MNDKIRDLLLRIAGPPDDTSINGDKTIINELLNNIDLSSGYVIDIGASDGVQSSNTYHLFRNGAPGLLVEPEGWKVATLAREYRNFSDVTIMRCKATPHNIHQILSVAQSPATPMFMSFDIDSYDYYVLREILTLYRPSLICTEINEKVPPPIRFAVKYTPDHKYTGDHFYGMSLAMLGDLCSRYRYELVNLNYNNAFLIPVELNHRNKAVSIESAYINGYLQRPDRKKKFSYNANMEPIFALETVEERLAFIRQFFSQYEGKYHLSAEEE